MKKTYRIEKGRVSTVVFRVFRYFPTTGRYAIAGDVNVGPRDSYRAAALNWAEKFAPSEVNELDLMIARFAASRITELKHVKLRRQVNPWAVVTGSPPGGDNWDDDEDEDDLS